LEEYILNIAKKWVSEPFNVDGWRLDVAADLGHSNEYNHYFWKKFRQVVKEANPNALILAEHYGNPKQWLQGDEWDTVMNYDAFMEPVTWFLTGMQKHGDYHRNDLEGNGKAFHDSMLSNMAKFSGPSLYCAMNQLSNHDHSRFLTRTNHVVGRVKDLGSEAAGENLDKALMHLAVLMQMTLPGAPTLYYGDEAGQVGFTDPDNRRTFPWGREDWELIQFHKDLIRIHKKQVALKDGSFKMLDYGNDYVSYGRFTEEEQLAIAINIDVSPMQKMIPVWELGVSREETVEMEIIFTSKPKGHSVNKKTVIVENGFLFVEIPAKSGLLIRNKN
jgi:alpha-glucosidase